MSWYLFTHSFNKHMLSVCSRLSVSPRSCGEAGPCEAKTELKFSCFKLGSSRKRGLSLHNACPLSIQHYFPLSGRILICIPSTESTKFKYNAATAAKSLQSCLTLCDPIDGSPPGSPVPGILQARTLEWVAISFSNAWKWKVKEKSLSRVRPSATPWTAAFQAPPSMGFSRQEYWSGVPLPGIMQMSSNFWSTHEGRWAMWLTRNNNSSDTDLSRCILHVSVYWELFCILVF